MIFKEYSIKDELSGFQHPIPFTQEAQAKRYFQTHMKETLEMKDNPKDFSIWYVGTFDSESGTFINDPKEMKLIMKGEECNGNSENTF